MLERLDHFMARANGAYYATRDPFADFTTAPEIGQMFGELLGAWAATLWVQMGRPTPFNLVEAGPGRGTLMQDVLRATGQVAPDFHAAATIHFIETSPRLRAAQAARVPHAAWHAALADVPDGRMILLANEFLDALPIRQFVRRAAGWAERYVRDGGLVEQPADGAPRAQDAPLGTIIETSPAQHDWVAELAARLARDGGAALILDYGTAPNLPPAGPLGDSLQALRNGKPADPLREPGTADLTAHVDFQAIAEAAREGGAAVWGPLTQGVFLQRLGLAARTARLAAAHPQRAAEFSAAAARLASPSQMGALFKVLCLAAPGQAAPPAFS